MDAKKNIIKLECKDTSNKIIELTINLNNNQFSAANKKKLIVYGKIFKAIEKENNLEIMLIPTSNSKEKIFLGESFSEKLKC
tara:strand:- start:127 stop:372 length:246 start_codon:yes stop_codon:yes gene_type:complete